MRRFAAITLLLVLCVFLGATEVSAQGYKKSDTLRGVKEIGVLFEKIKPDAVKDGLDGAQLETLTKARLRRAGITVPDDWTKPRFSGSPILVVTINTLR